MNELAPEELFRLADRVRETHIAAEEADRLYVSLNNQAFDARKRADAATIEERKAWQELRSALIENLAVIKDLV